MALRSVVGQEEELACRTILDLVETHGYRFDEIGVVANTRSVLHHRAQHLQSASDSILHSGAAAAHS